MTRYRSAIRDRSSTIDRLRTPWNLGRGWAGFDFEAAFKCPVKVVNDAAMQALGSYKGGKMLFLGLGTGLGSTMIVDGIIEPMELGHLPYKLHTFEDYVGTRGFARLGETKWRQAVADVITRLIAALEPEDVVLGGGNVKQLKKLPPACRAGDNANAFLGGFRLWKKNRRTKNFEIRKVRLKPKLKIKKCLCRLGQSPGQSIIVRSWRFSDGGLSPAPKTIRTPLPVHAP